MKSLLLWSLTVLACQSPDPPPPNPESDEPVYSWCQGRSAAGEPCWYRYRNGHLIAGWIPSTRTFRWYTNGAWSAPVPPPWEKEAPGKTEPPVLFGVVPDKIGPGEHYRIGDREVSKREAIQQLGAPSGPIPNDAANLRLTVIGSDDDRRRLLDDLAKSPALAAWRDKLVVQDYAPTDWAVTGAGFVTTGKPTVYLQQPDGKVLLRLDQYDSAEALAEAIRKADPNYRPDQDPDGKPKPPPAPAGDTGIPVAVWGLGGIALLLLLFKR